jgi:hypothetical protein
MEEDLKSLLTQLKAIERQVQGLIARLRAEKGLPPAPSEFPTTRRARIT